MFTRSVFFPRPHSEATKLNHFHAALACAHKATRSTLGMHNQLAKFLARRATGAHKRTPRNTSAHKRTRMHKYLHAHACNTRKHTQADTRARTHACTYARTHARTHARAHAHKHTHTYTHTYTQVYTHTHTRTHAHTRACEQHLRAMHFFRAKCQGS